MHKGVFNTQMKDFDIKNNQIRNKIETSLFTLNTPKQSEFSFIA